MLLTNIFIDYDYIMQGVRVMFKTIVEAVLSHAKETPNKLAVCFKGNKLTYAELRRYIKAFAYVISKEYNVSSNSIVMVSALSKPEYVTALLAIQFLGGTVVPVDKSAVEDTMKKLYRTVNPVIFLTDSKITDVDINNISLKGTYIKAGNLLDVPLYEKEFPEYVLPNMDSIAEIIFTTGTTGNPKGAMLSYKNILVGTEYTRDGVHRNNNNIELIPLPLNHSFGLRVLRTILYVGATAILQNGFMFPKEMVTNIEEYGCNGISIVPASVEKLYRNLGHDFAKIFGRFDYIEVSAGSLTVGMKQKLLNIIPHVHLYNVWGSSETGGVIFLDVTSYPEHIASLGVPAKGVEICMLDKDGNHFNATSADNAGRMIMKGDMQMRGYYNLPDVTAETLVNGYLYTGDLAYQTEDGFIYMLGRADDIINVGGEKVSPVEVENIASLFGVIRECACIGVPDPEGVLGFVPVLFVVPDNMEFREENLAHFLSKQLEQYKLPKKYVVVDALPRNEMKKIDRKKLKQIWENQNKNRNSNPVISAIFGRRSVRNFQEKHIPRDMLELLVECGKQAPSGHNMQTWHFTVITNQHSIRQLKETIPNVAKRNGVYFYGFDNPDAIILVSNDIRNQYGVQDSSCATQNIMLAAHSMGIGSVWLNPLMKICDEPEIRDLLTLFGVPQNYNVWSMIALGYPANKPDALAKKDNVVNWVE